MEHEPYRLVLRMPQQLRLRIDEAAKHYRRSKNSEIVARLQQSFGVLPSDQTERALDPPLNSHLEALLRQSLSNREKDLIRAFRRLNSDKQQALIDLLT